MVAKKLFGTSGIRGKVGSEVTCELALNVGKSLALYLGNKGTVVLGHDTRTTNEMLDQAICAGLLESGVDVIKIGMVPTPLVGYATEKLDADAGIMLTASHNPSQYNEVMRHLENVKRECESSVWAESGATKPTECDTIKYDYLLATKTVNAE